MFYNYMLFLTVTLLKKQKVHLSWYHFYTSNYAVGIVLL